MMPVDTLDKTIDPIELLNRALDQAWEVIREGYDLTACLPDMLTLFKGVDLSVPARAAKTVMANMLLEAMESVSRFSPWYTLPARAYGLVSLKNQENDQMIWSLAPEANQRWCDILEDLEIAIRKNSAIIQATILVDGILEHSEGDCLITVSCQCLPPRVLNLRKSAIEQGDIICDICQHPFT